MNTQVGVPPPHPIPLRVGIPLSPLSPRHREHAIQPPALTTSLGGLSFQGLGFSAGYSPAPNSTISLSSPFSQHAPSPYSPSPGAGSQGTSPMATRLSGGFNASYNPREWGSARGGSPQIGAGPMSQTQPGGAQARASQQQQDNEEPPPPPYSPPAQNSVSRPSLSTTLTPSDSRSLGYATPQSTTPVNRATGGRSERLLAKGPPRPRPVSVAQSSSTGGTAQSAFPPPPPPSRANPRQRTDRSPFSFSTLASRARQTSGSTSVNTVDNLHGTTVEAPQQPPELLPSSSTYEPPASKRAASAGGIGTSVRSSRTSSQSESRSPSRPSGWEPGMPLPGPPPGPPPSASRSQSASGIADPVSRHMLMPAPRPKTRQAPQLGSLLDPVPPTPAGWTDEGSGSSTTRHITSLHIDTKNISSRVPETVRPGQDSCSSPEQSTGVRISSSGLYRSSARRDASAKGIRERRSESRSARDVSELPSALSISSYPLPETFEAARPADMSLVHSASSSIPTPTTMNMTTVPRSARSATPEDSALGAGVKIAEDAAITTRPGTGRSQLSLDLVQTPPFSPKADPASTTMSRDSSRIQPPKALPTPPLQRSRAPSISSHLAKSHLQERPVSHILHLPNEMSSITPAPLSPRRIPLSAKSDGSQNDHQEYGDFIQRSLERHQEFLQRERSATKDEDRLQIFADYILAESRLRRGRYSQAWASGNFDVRHVRERLFEQNMHVPRRPSGLQESTLASPTQPGSPSSISDSHLRPDSTWWNNYQPCLSPIASMSMNDEMSSRGRTPSRWWESHTGSNGEGKAQTLERSKRESKYMGLQRGSWVQSDRGGIDKQPSGGIMNPAEYGEYPPEKVNPERFGYQDDFPTPPFLPSPAGQPPISETAKVARIDVSRLVTLPPPYPRHFPAVNNNHPGLVSYRTIVRSVSDYEDLVGRRQRYRANAEALEKDSQQKLSDSRRLFRSNIHAQIEDGSISYAEAAEAEEALRMEERDMEKQRVQADFDSFQDVVLNPVHDTLNERIRLTTIHIDELRDRLLRDAESRSPDQTQEEGDEQPELLEKLTQLKWLFEAREQLHREIFLLLSERNRKFKAIVLLPYQQSNNKDKVRDTEVFFSKDEQDRHVSFESDSLTRYREFLEVIEENVAQGVELQLSAFWDIAPNLLKVLQDLPEELGDFDILIPPDEYVENPSYREHPLQYLYSLLCHADRSTYQFIESQTNLLCLLHEAKSGMMAARCKLSEVERIRESDGCEEEIEAVKASVAEQRSHEEDALTLELKEKVKIVEGQWREALGDILQATKDRIQAWLTQQGGWEDVEQADD